MIHVSAAVIMRNQEVLICQRKLDQNCGGLWEFPGGKQEDGETAEACLVRECQEELGATVSVGPAIVTCCGGSTSAPLQVTFFLSTVAQGEARCLEHNAMKWVPPSTLHTYAFCPVDASALAQIQSHLTAQKSKQRKDATHA